MTRESLETMRQEFDKMLTHFSLDNLSSPQLIERARIIENALMLKMKTQQLS